MSTSCPQVQIVPVNWNAGRHTLSCLTYLQAVSYPSYHVVIVDNASSDRSPEAIAVAYPDMPLLRLPQNLGFTGANNVGFEYGQQPAPWPPAAPAPAQARPAAAAMHCPTCTCHLRPVP
jgi:hypothetical protein